MSMSFNRYMPDEDGQWSQGLISAVCVSKPWYTCTISAAPFICDNPISLAFVSLFKVPSKRVFMFPNWPDYNVSSQNERNRVIGSVHH